jgi:hypothetical protein
MQPRKISPANDNIEALGLLSMPARARAIAAQCGSQLIAELLELHARLSERNLEASPSRKGRPVRPRLVDKPV